MNKNKLLKIFFSFILLSSFALAQTAENNTVQPEKKEIKIKPQPNFTIDNEKSGIDEKTQSILSRIGFGKFVDSNSTKDIEDFFKIFEKYTQKGDISKLKSLYSEDFINNDGFDKKTYFELLTLVSDLYDDANYTMTIKDIKREGDFAFAFVDEEATALTSDTYSEISGTGVVKSSSKYLYYLQKIDGKWKISGLDSLYEKTVLSYGDARELIFDIKAPFSVKNGSKYEIDLTISEIPKNSVVIASLTNDPIVYPQVNNDEVFRTLNNKKTLQRIVTANSNNYNEYATATIGVTKAGIVSNEDINSIRIFMTGMAFVMTRVNVKNVIEHKIEHQDKKAKNVKPEN